VPTYFDGEQFVERQDSLTPQHKEGIKKVFAFYGVPFRTDSNSVYYRGTIEKELLLNYSKKAMDKDWLATHMFLLPLTSCAGHNQEQAFKTLDLGTFTIVVPDSWRKSTAQGKDSYVSNIIIDSSDTLSFDLGHFSNPLSERDPIIFSREDFRNRGDSDSTDLILVDDYRQAKELDQYKKQNLLWDSVDGREAKIVYPRKSGIGITGVYIDSLWTTKFGKDRFKLSGENMKPENQRLFLQAIKTIKFKKTE